MSQTVARALSILRFVSESPRSLGDVADSLEVHKSTALRLLQTLEHDGFVRQLATGRYAIGFAVVALAHSALNQIDVRAIAHPHVAGLAHRIGHTVHLAQLVGSEITYVDKVDGNESVAMGSQIGAGAEFHTAAVAKVILANLGPRRERLLNSVEFTRYTPTTVQGRSALVQELDETLWRGWAEDDGEKEDYLNCIAVPINDATGSVTIGLSVTALRASAPLALLRKLVPSVREVAEVISRELGWGGPIPTAQARR